jgi:hypothetical protein
VIDGLKDPCLRPAGRRIHQHRYMRHVDDTDYRKNGTGSAGRSRDGAPKDIHKIAENSLSVYNCKDLGIGSVFKLHSSLLLEETGLALTYRKPVGVCE